MNDRTESMAGMLETTERQVLLEELQQQRDQLREIITEQTSKLASTKKALQKCHWVLAESQRVAHLGSWDWDIIAGMHHWSDEFYRIIGLLPQEIGATYEAFLTRVHPDDRQVVDQANQEALADPDKPYTIEYRVVRPDGSECLVHARGQVSFDQEHRPLRMIGTLQDISERKHAAEELQNAYNEITKLKEQLEAENSYLREEMALKDGSATIIGASDPIKEVMHRIHQVAQTRTTVLLTGETGTGKGVFARSLHKLSGRWDKPFVHVNCSSLPPALIESELFGREKGAFTGAVSKQIGRFELASHGTIFLDEIGELPLELQTKLLKVIEEGTIERLGSSQTVKVDVRIIASTNRTLEDEIKEGRFRADLFYRLHVFPIVMPPLRQRREDIPLFVQFYTDKFSKSLGKGIKKIPENIMQDLENYTWPGNVRELINVIERAVIVSTGSELRLAEKIGARPVSALLEKVSQTLERQAPKGLCEVEREYILKTLAEVGWRIEGDQGAAKLLNMNPSTLRARMRKLEIRRPGTR